MKTPSLLRPLVWILSPVLWLACATTASAPDAAPASALATDMAPAQATPPPAPMPPELRLPKYAHPVRYAAELTVVPTQDTFQGKIDIDLEVTAATSLLWLNATELKIASAQLTQEGTTMAARVVPGGADFAGFAFERPVAPGQARLSVSYEGVIDKERTQGLYREQEKDAWYAYTVFEPVDARRVFPCFDEPEYKVPWRLSLRVRAGDVALANSAVESQGAPLADGTQVVTFAETKPLPSYLIAFVVGPFDVVDAGTFGRGKTPLRFIVPQGRRDELGYALKVSGRLVTALEDYFDMTYPFGKLDVAVVPRFRGTMEHPGLVAMGQPLTLIPAKEETLQRQQWYARTFIHELAHYWFGDYVTMAWWDDLWLNESSATWIEAKLIHQLEPSWKEPEDRLWEHLSALHTDSLATSHPIRQTIASRTDFESAFDGSITYFKGSSVLGMFERWLGEETFRRGIQRFMREHAWGTATAPDLLAALSAESGRDVASALSTFLDQAGAPLVSVELECTQGKPPRLKLSQTRFFVSPPSGGTRGAEQWQIPICVRYGGAGPQGRACTLLTEPSGELVLSEAKACPTWIAANEEAQGYYRASYSEPLRKALVKADFKPLTPRERGAMLADLRAFATASRFPLGEALAMAPGLLKAQDRASTEAGMAMLGLLRPDVLPGQWLPHYERLLRAVVVPRARTLGWRPRPGESEDTKKLREMLVITAARGGKDPALLAESRELAKAWLADPSAVDPDSVFSVLASAGSTGDRALFDALMGRVRKETQPEKRQLLLAALGSFRDPQLVREALMLVVDGTFPARDGLGLLYTSVNGRETRATAYAFVKENFDTLLQRMGAQEGSALFMMPGFFCDKASRDDAHAFLSPRASRVDGAPLVLARALERVDLCIATWERNQAAITTFLKRY
jgi:alanyl aminopeptidase